MLESHYKNLDSNEQILLQQIAANPAFNKLLYLEKEDLEQQILNFYRIEEESAEKFCRRLEGLHKKHGVIADFISLNKYLLNK